MSDQMWMGIPTSHMQWVPCPSINSTITRNRFVERLQFQNGGGDVRRSPAYQMQYDFSFTALAHEAEGIDAFNRFASGFYGDGLIYLAHPANFETNMFSAGWASPGLAEQGWPKISDNAVTFSNTDSTAVDSYAQPARTAVYNITTVANSIPTNNRFTLVIPPTHKLYIGASFVATGDAVVQIRPVFLDGSYDSTYNLTEINPGDSNRIATNIDGSIHRAVEVYITRTSSAASTIAITSMIARLYKSTITEPTITQHYTGEGATGLMFADSAIVETYSYMHPPRKGISTTLVEVEAWR